MIKRKQNNKTITTDETKAWVTWTLLKTGMNTGGWHRRMDTSCLTSRADWVTEQKDYQWSKGNRTKRLSMIKRKKIINDQKETEQTDYQWSKGNRTNRLSMIKRKQNTKNINDLKETEQKDYQWSKGKRLSMIKRK